MRTHLDCIPCFFTQALEAARLCGAGSDLQKKILDETARAIPDFPLGSSPPEMGRIIHRIVRECTGIADPYISIKRKSNEYALEMYEKFKQKMTTSPDRLLSAVEMAIAGNIIDFGVKNSVNVGEELERILIVEHSKIVSENKELFQYDDFKADLEKADNILYLADNAGETVFDRILIEELDRRGKSVEYAVKEKPIINDALREDAEQCLIHKLAKIISSGSDAPGTVLSLCAPEFLKKLSETDMVISKGQGNFEALAGAAERPVYFLLMAKCPVVANDVGCELGDILLLRK